jgi:integrase
MEQVDFDIDKRFRTRVYSDHEIKLIWNAADKLKSEEGAYVKLLLLLAPRKSALAALKYSDLKDGIWTTPWELTKSKKKSQEKNRTYLTPLPPLAQRILKGVPKSDTADPDRVFPSLRIAHTRSGQPTFDSVRLVRKLIENGAPKDFMFHTARHTLATWLIEHGHSEYEVAQILNHAGSGVTAGYIHSTSVKLELLEKWASHIEALVQPEGVTLLR